MFYVCVLALSDEAYTLIILHLKVTLTIYTMYRHIHIDYLIHSSIPLDYSHADHNADPPTMASLEWESLNIQSFPGGGWVDSRETVGWGAGVKCTPRPVLFKRQPTWQYALISRHIGSVPTLNNHSLSVETANRRRWA